MTSEGYKICQRSATFDYQKIIYNQYYVQCHNVNYYFCFSLIVLCFILSDLGDGLEEEKTEKDERKERKGKESMKWETARGGERARRKRQRKKKGMEEG